MPVLGHCCSLLPRFLVILCIRHSLPKHAYPTLRNQLHPTHGSGSLAIVPRVRNIPMPWPPLRAKRNLIKHAANDYFPLLTFSKKSWRNTLFLVPQAKGQKLVACGLRCVHTYIHIYIHKAKDAMNWQFYQIHFWLFLRIWWHWAGILQGGNQLRQSLLPLTGCVLPS